MAAVMEDNEDPDQESGGDNRESESDPVGETQGVVHQHPHGDVWSQGVHDLPDALSQIGPVILFDYGNPGLPVVFTHTLAKLMVSRRLR